MKKEFMEKIIEKGHVITRRYVYRSRYIWENTTEYIIRIQKIGIEQLGTEAMLDESAWKTVIDIA